MPQTSFLPEEEDVMKNELHEMSTVTQKESGVEVRVQGRVEKESIEEMVEKCSTGTQSCCGPDFFAKVTSIKVSGQDGDVSIHVNGNDVTKEMIEDNLRNCTCYEP
jgi:predicted sugar kinase